MVRKKSTPNELYWDAQKRKQIREAYEQFLRSEQKEGSPDNAQLFAMSMIGTGHDYMGLTERELILFLEGSLPFMYD